MNLLQLLEQDLIIMNFKHPYFDKGAIERLYRDYLKYGCLYIAFDFDNTIWDYDKYKGNYANIKEAVHWDIINLLKRAKNYGMKLILWTSCPTEYDEAIKNDLCKTWGISPDYLNWSPLSPGATKPHFNLLIDDRGGLESSINILTGLFDKIDNK